MSLYDYDFGMPVRPCGDCFEGHCTMNCGVEMRLQVPSAPALLSFRVLSETERLLPCEAEVEDPKTREGREKSGSGFGCSRRRHYQLNGRFLCGDHAGSQVIRAMSESVRGEWRR